MIKNKGGQFYLITALVIISLIVGYAAVSNYAEKKEYSKTYDLAEELEIESAEVLDYGVYKDINIEQMQNLLEGFIELYSEDVGKLDELYFIFGNKDEIVFVGYHQLQDSLSAGIGLDGTTPSTTPLYLSKETVSSTLITGDKIKKVAVGINYLDGVEDEYEFKLKKGNNFYFILTDVEGGEKTVITSKPPKDRDDKDEETQPGTCEEDDDCNNGYMCYHDECVECKNDDSCNEGYECNRDTHRCVIEG